MSTLDQPLLIANSNYHVGHQVAIFVAEEQGFFREEGLKEYEYDARGLIPGPLERDGLAMAITNHGVDIATAVDVDSRCPLLSGSLAELTVLYREVCRVHVDHD